MYKCHYCGEVSEPRQLMLRHTTYRKVVPVTKYKTILAGLDLKGRQRYRVVEDGESKEGKQIVSEEPVCRDCHSWLILAGPKELVRHLKLHGRSVEQKNVVRVDSKGTTTTAKEVALLAKPAVRVRFGVA